MLFFLPLIALGAMVLCRRPSTPAGAAPRAISGMATAPSPLLVLDGFVRMGQTPPPQVILCAIAEAELLGRVDVANELVLAFVIPVIDGFEAARPLAVPTYGRLPYAQPPSYPQARLPARRRPAYGYPQDDEREDASYAREDASYVRDPAWEGEASQPAWPIPEPAPAMAAVPGAPQANRAPATGPHAPHVASDPAAPRRRPPRPLARPEDARVEILSKQAPTAPAAPTRHAGTITVSGRSSPIEGIGTEEWGSFINRVSREVPTFTTSRHVGQFRQRKDRLAELGIDPSRIVNSPDAQVAALEADMRDAYAHASQSGLVSDHLGATVAVPTSDGSSTSTRITLPGLLGIIQAAGLEGAAQWLEDPADRVRFPNTTQAFARTNGVF